MNSILARTLCIFICAAAARETLAQGCAVNMTRNYNTYTSSTSDGSHIYTTVTVEGSASCTPSPGCPCNTAIHTPKALNKVGAVGGWATGPAGCVSCYVSFRNYQTIAAAAGTTVTLTWQGEIICSIAGTFYNIGGNQPVVSYTQIQHNYPRNPLPVACRISSFFDAVRNAKAHKAEDVIKDNGNGTGSPPPYGTPVTSMEAGTVIAAVTGKVPASLPYPQCAGTGAPGNYVKIKADGDTFSTIYFHVKPSVTVNQHVAAGQQIGILDNSGCQSGAHLHVGRKDASGTPVNFTIPCVNPTPFTSFFDGVVGDDVPDTI